MNEQKANPVDDAIKACDAVIDETQKSLANAYYFRASAKVDKKDFDGAIGDYGLALKLYPADPDYLNSRGAAYEAKNDLDHALTDYNAAIKADPKAVNAYNSRGAAYQRKGDFARAAADYSEVTRLQPDNIDAWSARCWVRAITPGQTQLALGDCNAALKIKADAADVLDTRGFVNLKLDQNDNAIKDYDAALKLDPKLPARCTAAASPSSARATRTAAQPTSPPPRRSSRHRRRVHPLRPAVARVSDRPPAPRPRDQRTPSQFGAVSRSPRSSTPKIATSTTDSLSIGATWAAWPIFSARK